MSGSLTVNVVDNKDCPVSGKKVFLVFESSVLTPSGTWAEEYTGEDGVASFDDVPIGSVEVSVDGEYQTTVSVGEDDHEDVTVCLSSSDDDEDEDSGSTSDEEPPDSD